MTRNYIATQEDIGIHNDFFAYSHFTTIVDNDVFSGIYTTNSPEAVRYVVEHSRANLVVVEDQEQLDKVLWISMTKMWVG